MVNTCLLASDIVFRDNAGIGDKIEFPISFENIRSVQKLFSHLLLTRKKPT